MRNGKRRDIGLMVLTFLFQVAAIQAGPIHVISSTSDLAAIAREVGGTDIIADALCRADQDPHHFEILPRHVLSARQADIYLKVGAGLDYWADDLITTAQNRELLVIDCSNDVDLLQDEDGEAEHGHEQHMHELGNPHYWLAPTNWTVIAQSIASALASVDPTRAAEVDERLRRFETRVDSSVLEWRKTMQPCVGAGIVTYHRTWDYFAHDFGLRIVGTIEPQPGAEPSPQGLALLEQAIRQEGAVVILSEPFAPPRLANLLARDTGIQIVSASPSVGSGDELPDLILHMDRLVRDVRACCATRLQENE